MCCSLAVRSSFAITRSATAAPTAGSAERRTAPSSAFASRSFEMAWRPSAPPPPADACRFSDTASALSASTFWTESPRTRGGGAAGAETGSSSAPRGTVPRVNGCFCALRGGESSGYISPPVDIEPKMSPSSSAADSWSPRSEPPGVRPWRSRSLHPSPSAGAPNEGAIPRVARLS